MLNQYAGCPERPVKPGVHCMLQKMRLDDVVMYGWRSSVTKWNRCLMADTACCDPISAADGMQGVDHEIKADTGHEYAET